jgi:hypothetical protein
MLLGNPFSLVLRGRDRYAANLAFMIGPLVSISVSAQSFLHFIAESSLARLCGYWHDSP